MTARRSLSATERLRLFTLHGGICHICGEKIDGTRERWDIEHVIPWALTRDDSDGNRKPAHYRCHKPKTASEDIPRIAKAKRQARGHIGAKRAKGRPMPGTKASGWKQRIGGRWERRT